jgi:hypothetical protein
VQEVEAAEQPQIMLKEEVVEQEVLMQKKL